MELIPLSFIQCTSSQYWVFIFTHANVNGITEQSLIPY